MLPDVILARALVAASAAIILILGALHLVYTFRGPKLTPRDPVLTERMKKVSPVITREITMWQAWMGFNASHSLGAILFGSVYGYLAVAGATFFFESRFLMIVGFAMLGAYAVLGKLYFFRIPYGGILIALVSYTAAMIVRFAATGGRT